MLAFRSPFVTPVLVTKLGLAVTQAFTKLLRSPALGMWKPVGHGPCLSV